MSNNTLHRVHCPPVTEADRVRQISAGPLQPWRPEREPLLASIIRFVRRVLP
jgi:hypothetical protein